MTEQDAELREKVISGIRWVFIFNLVAVPLSFSTNMMLGRVSPAALGTYGAIQIYVAGVQALFVLGGHQVFARVLPSISRESRFPFLRSYAILVLAILLASLGTAFLIAPRWCGTLLERFGNPHPMAAIWVAVAVVVWLFSSHYLYGVLRAPRAVITLKTVVIGYFLFVLPGFFFFREILLDRPDRYLWTAALGIYGLAAVVGITGILTTTEYRKSSGRAWYLPGIFWQVVLYTHLTKLVLFVYSYLAPSMVLLWLDVASLGKLHAALRFVALTAMIPVMVSSVISPGIATLDSAGRRDKALRQASRAIRVSLLMIVPAALFMICLSRDVMSIFGEKFIDSRHLLVIVAVSCVSGPLIHIGGGIAVATGELRSYLLASMIYVASMLGLSVGLVPVFGLEGAAAAVPAGVIVHHTGIALVLRLRLGFRMPKSNYSAVLCSVSAMALALYIDPGRIEGALLFITFTSLFFALAGVTPRECTDLVRTFLNRR